MKNFKRTRGNGSSGQALVEFAVALPVLLIILMGMLEWGFLLWTKTTYVNAVRDGARTAVVLTGWGAQRISRETEIRDVVLSRVAALPASVRQDISSRMSIELLPADTDVRSIRVSIVNQPYIPLIGFTRGVLPATLSASAEFRFESTQ